MKLCGHVVDPAGRFFLIAGPCVIESRDLVLRTAERLTEIAARLGLFFIFKSSYDKANRSSITSFRGPGIDAGLAILDEVRRQFGVPVTTDVHSVEEIGIAAGAVDVIQIPAFLCRQTDMLIAAGRSGAAVNVRRGQFVAPSDVAPIVEKLTASGCESYGIIERGYTFGYNNLVVDMRSFAIMRAMGVPVIFDATHSTQLPGGGTQSGGERDYAPLLARSAVAAGVDGLFMEVHPCPDEALCDATNQYYLDRVEPLLATLIEIDRLAKGTGG